MQASDHVLLTGAGFTHNFGTPLARDVWNLVFNHRRRLLIIGYGFCDEHVNRALAEAIHGDHIELFILSRKPAQDLRAEVQSKPHGEQIWEGLRGHFPGTLLDVFPNDQSQTPLWREIDARFF